LYTVVDVSDFLNDVEIKEQSSKRAMSNSDISYSQISISATLKPRLHCSSDGCEGYTFFEMLSDSQRLLYLLRPSIHKLVFKCCNCKETTYEFYLDIIPSVKQNADNDTLFKIQKVGQYPRHGKPAPKKTLKLLGKERGLFFKGAISENQGMGIGAFSYYRRVLDAQKDKIFDEVIRVLKLNVGNETLIQELTEAKAETQFTNAIKKIKTALPDGLKINGHDPLSLLYSALSECLHNHTDEECLENAQDIKMVLFQFSDRLDSALKDDAELSDAVNRLARKGKK
jgi:hypothetical protein